MPRTAEASANYHEQTTGARLKEIQKFFDDVSFDVSNGYTLEEIWEKSGTQLTLDSLRLYLLNWERDNSLTFTDKFGVKWHVVRHREHKKASIRRLSVISLDTSMKSIDSDVEHVTVFFDRQVPAETALTSQLLTRGEHWNYLDYIDHLENFCQSAARREQDQVVAAVNKYSTREIQEEFQRNDREPIVWARRIILVCGVKVYTLLSSYGLLSADGTVISQDDRINIDSRWFSLMPHFHSLIEYCHSHGFTPDFLQQSLQICSILFTPKVGLDTFEDVPRAHWEDMTDKGTHVSSGLRAITRF